MADELPVITQVIANAVLVCCCPAKIVMVVNVIAGEIECPQCKQNWRIKKFLYETDQSGNGRARLEATMERGSAILAPDAVFAMPKRPH